MGSKTLPLTSNANQRAGSEHDPVFRIECVCLRGHLVPHHLKPDTHAADELFILGYSRLLGYGSI